jgi:branched-chain amino acid transport system substrate-binding protein
VRLRLLAALAALLLAGCGTQEDIRRGGTVLGETLAVYSSLPAPSHGASRDIVDGERLALQQAGGRAGAYKINFASIDEGAADPSQETTRAAAATFAAIKDTQTVAVIGGLESDAAMVSVPLLNAAGILQVSPGAGYAGFTERVGRGEPERWFPASRTTFARIVGDDRAQAAAMLSAARARSVVLETEATPAARALAAELRRAARAGGVRLTGDETRAQAVLYAGGDAVNAAGVAASVARRAPRARIVLPDAVVRAGVESRLDPAAARRVLLVSSAPAPGSTPALRSFAAAFRASFGRAPGPYAAAGHAAMRSVLDAVARAGSRAGDRQAVINAYFGRPAVQTVLGPIRFAPSGAVLGARFSVRRPAGAGGP